MWPDTCAERSLTPKRTRPYRPQTNGKIERFHRTLAEGWAFKKFYNSESARLAALPAWVHEYNHCESTGPHSATRKAAPHPEVLPTSTVLRCYQPHGRVPKVRSPSAGRLRPSSWAVLWPC